MVCLVIPRSRSRSKICRVVKPQSTDGMLSMENGVHRQRMIMRTREANENARHALTRRRRLRPVTSDPTSTLSSIECSTRMSIISGSAIPPPYVSSSLHRPGACHSTRRCLHQLCGHIAAKAGLQPTIFLCDLELEAHCRWPEPTSGAIILLGECCKE
jgi:hypothetical protein